MQTTVLSAEARVEVTSPPDRANDALWLTGDALHEVSGWKLEPEGLCKEGVCAPLPAESEPGSFGGQDLVCASRLWAALGRPVLHDSARTTWFLGEAAEDRSRRLESLEAPDFVLPDIDGTLHRLSDHRGQKVLLATWASW
jgi:hypothetical protein